jgi:hypothetical protein
MAITTGQNANASDFVGTSSGAADSGKVAKLNANGKIPEAFVSPVSIATGAGAPVSLSITTLAGQRVVCFAKGVYDPGGTAGYTDIVLLQYNGVTKDSNAIAGTGSAGTVKANQPFALMYTETPGAGTHDITVTATTPAALASVSILAFVLD